MPTRVNISPQLAIADKTRTTMGRNVLPPAPRPRLTSIAEEERKIFAGEPGGLGLQDIAGVEGWNAESYVRYLEKTNPLMVRALAEQLRRQKDALRIAAMGAARAAEAIPRLPLGPTVDVAMQAAEGLPPTFEVAPTLFKTGIAIPARVGKLIDAIQLGKKKGLSAVEAVKNIGSGASSRSNPSEVMSTLPEIDVLSKGAPETAVNIQFKAGALTDEIVDVLGQHGMTLDKLEEIAPKGGPKRRVLESLQRGEDLDDGQLGTLNGWLKNKAARMMQPPLKFQGSDAPLTAPSREVLPGGQSARSLSRIKGPPGSQMSDATKRAIAEGEIGELPPQDTDLLSRVIEDTYNHVVDQFVKGPEEVSPAYGFDMDMVQDIMDNAPPGFEDIIDAIRKRKDLTPAQLKKLGKGLEDIDAARRTAPYFNIFGSQDPDDIGIQIPGLTADLRELMEASTAKSLKEALRALENFDESALGADELKLYKRSMEMVKRKLGIMGDVAAEAQKSLESVPGYKNFGELDQFLEGLPLDATRVIKEYDYQFKPGPQGKADFEALLEQLDKMDLTTSDYRQIVEHYSKWYNFARSDAGGTLYGPKQASMLAFLKRAAYDFQVLGSRSEWPKQGPSFYKFFTEADGPGGDIEIDIEGLKTDSFSRFMVSATKKSAQEALDALERFDPAVLDASERNVFEWVYDYLKKSIKDLPEEVADELSGFLSEDMIRDIDRIIEEGDPAKIAKLRQTLVDLIEQGNKMKADEDLSGLLGLSAIKAKLKKLDDATKGSNMPDFLADDVALSSGNMGQIVNDMLKNNPFLGDPDNHYSGLLAAALNQDLDKWADVHKDLLRSYFRSPDAMGEFVRNFDLADIKKMAKKLGLDFKGLPHPDTAADAASGMADLAKTPQVVKEDHPLFALDLGPTELAQRLPSEFWKGGMNRPTAIKLLQDSGLDLDEATEWVDDIMAEVKKAALDLTKPGSKSDVDASVAASFKKPLEGEDVLTWAIEQSDGGNIDRLDSLSPEQMRDAVLNAQAEFKNADPAELDALSSVYNTLIKGLKSQGIRVSESLADLVNSGMIGMDTLKSLNLHASTRRFKLGSPSLNRILSEYGMLDESGKPTDWTAEMYKELEALAENDYVSVRDVLEWLGYGQS